MTLAATISGGACGGGAEPAVPPPSPPAAEAAFTLEPDILLDFGAIPAGTEATREVLLRSTGERPLTVEEIRLASGQPDKWEITFDPIVELAPGGSAALRIRFRPCPKAWNQDEIDPDFDLSGCFGAVAAAGLEIASNAPPGRRTLSLGGRARLPPPVIEVSPPEELHFGYPSGRWVRRTKNVIVRNDGYDDLRIHSIDIRPEAAKEEFWIRNLDCFSYPCELDVDICSSRRDGCVWNGAAFLEVQYVRYDRVDRGELVISTNDPARPEVVVQLLTSAELCFWPEPSIELQPGPYCAGTEVSLSAALYDELSGTPTAYGWQWIFTPGTPPALDPEVGAVTTFVPEVPGIYMFGVTATNDCGKTSETPAVAWVEVIAGDAPFCLP